MLPFENHQIIKLEQRIEKLENLVLDQQNIIIETLNRVKQIRDNSEMLNHKICDNYNDQIKTIELNENTERFIIEEHEKSIFLNLNNNNNNINTNNNNKLCIIS